jgi:hypothetical protein
MAHVGKIGSRTVILVKTDLPGVYQPLTDASGTMVGFEAEDLFNPAMLRGKRGGLMTKAREIAEKCTKYEVNRRIIW